MTGHIHTIVALDVGMVRTGVAIGNSLARLARPLVTLPTDQFAAAFAELAKQESPDIVVVGLPRNLSGQPTQQTAYVEDFVRQQLATYTVVFQDEAVTSKKAEAELAARKKPYTKADIDALAATYILQDYFDTQPVEAR